MVDSTPGTEAVWLAEGGRRIEARWTLPHLGAPRERAIVLLHEGLGCVAMWRDFPEQVLRRTGLAVLAYSRAGYGGSDPVSLPRPLTYMHDEGRRALGEVLDGAGVQHAWLVGHSDGGSIALVHAAEADDAGRVKGMVLLAPHVICEDVSVRAIEAARREFEGGDLRAKLARHHGENVDVAFRGWNQAWLDPGFREWSLQSLLPKVRAPVVVVQGADDPYGTQRQVDLILAGVSGPARAVILPSTGHAPWRERPRETLDAIASMFE